ncbi:MAG: flagellin [Selenomonadaceae bacterium]|nr:flagellin [Selenomonadaceae bacterium]
MAFTIHGELARGADGLTTILNRHQTAMGKSIEKISSGQKINHAGDDSAGNAISEKMKTQIRALDQSQENTQSAGALLGVANASMTSMLDVIVSMRTKTIKAFGSTDDDERAILQSEIDQLKDEIVGEAMVMHNGRYLFDGRFGQLRETIEDTSTFEFSYQNQHTYTLGEYGDNNKINEKLNFNDMGWDIRWTDEGEDSARMYFQVGPEPGDVVTTHLMNMHKIFDGLTIDVTNDEAASKTLQSLDNLTTRIMYQLTEISSVQERLEFTSENLQQVSEDTTAALSTIQDTDLAKEMTKFVKNNVLMQATQAMMAQANTTLNSFVNLIPTATR